MDKVEFLRTQLELTFSPMDYIQFKQQNPENTILVDVRNAPKELDPEKIQGAIEIPLEELQSRLAELPKSSTIVVYCWDTWCNMGRKASLILHENGYTAKEINGGIAAWRLLKLPTEPAGK